MKALVLNQFGEAPQIVDTELSAPGESEVAVQIAACGLNFADLLMLKGTYQDTPPPPFTPGMELAGTVTAIGAGVTNLQPGDRIAAFAGRGGLAEAGLVDAGRCIKLPESMPFAEAAGFLVAYGTSHLALTDSAGLGPGERLLVLGASGGVGLTAVELGKTLGAEVIAVARGESKLRAAKEAGADHLIDPEQQDIREAARALGGADVIYDAVGGESFKSAMRATKPGGRVLLIGFASGELPQIAANHLLVKNISVHGFYWGGYLKWAPERFFQSLNELFALYEANKLSPHIGATVPFERAHEALDMLRNRSVSGKIVVTMEP